MKTQRVGVLFCRECVDSDYGMNSFGKRACSIYKALSHGDVGGYGSRKHR
jgi:hypothetical protein